FIVDEREENSENADVIIEHTYVLPRLAEITLLGRIRPKPGSAAPQSMDFMVTPLYGKLHRIGLMAKRVLVTPDAQGRFRTTLLNWMEQPIVLYKGMRFAY